MESSAGSEIAVNKGEFRSYRRPAGLRFPGVRRRSVVGSDPAGICRARIAPIGRTALAIVQAASVHAEALAVFVAPRRSQEEAGEPGRSKDEADYGDASEDIQCRHVIYVRFAPAQALPKPSLSPIRSIIC